MQQKFVFTKTSTVTTLSTMGFVGSVLTRMRNEGTGPAEQAQFIKDKKKLSSVRDWRLAAAQAVEDFAEGTSAET